MSRNYLEKIEENPWFSLGSSLQHKGNKAKPWFPLLLCPLSLSSFSLLPFSLIPHVPRGLSSIKPLCLVNKRGKRWPKSATFPLEPTWAPLFFCLAAWIRSTVCYTSGRPNSIFFQFFVSFKPLFLNSNLQLPMVKCQFKWHLIH